MLEVIGPAPVSSGVKYHRAFMTDAHKINRLCGRFLRFFIVLGLCLVGLYVGVVLVFFGPLAWPIAGLWFFGAGWAVIRLKGRFRSYDHDT